MGIISEIFNILFIPYIFTPVVLFICLLTCLLVIRYQALRTEDVTFIIFAVIICVVIKTPTLPVLEGTITPEDQPVFLFAYFSIHILRNMLSLFKIKLQEQCYYSSISFYTSFSVFWFTCFIPLYILLFGILIYKCLELAPNRTLPITIPEFLVIPLDIAQVIYTFDFTRRRSKDNQWSIKYFEYFFVNIHFDFCTLFLLFIHYISLFIIVQGQYLKTIWMAFQVFRILFVGYSKLKSVKNYFTHLHVLVSLKVCDLNEGDCCICYSPLKKKCICLPCSHKFHHSCAISWLERNMVCPLCKQNILPEKLNTEKFIKRLSKSSQIIVRLYQLMFKDDNLNEDIKKIKDLFPMLPDRVILQELQRVSSVNEVINYFANNPELLNQYSLEIIDDASNEEREQFENDLMDQMNENNIEENNEEDIEEEEEEVDMEELHRLNEVRKRKLIEENL